MKHFFILMVLFFQFLVLNGQERSNYLLYVGTFTSEGAEGIYLCNFNDSTGEISIIDTFKGIDNPSFLKLSPDKEYLYVVSRATPAIEKSGGFVVAYKVAKNGTIKFLNKQISNGSGPCHVDVSPDGEYVAVATYGGGTVSIYPVKNNGALLPASSIIINKGSGPDKSRQKEPHAHSVKFSPFNNTIFSADLGTDQLNIFQLVDAKLLPKAQKFVKLAPGAGPRHFEFHPGGEVMYVINELNSTITTIKKERNKWTRQHSISILSPEFNEDSYCADIHISGDGKFLYGSNRGENTIAVCKIKEGTNDPEYLGSVSTEGNWPRNFTLSPFGNFMLVANQKSGNITVFKIDKETGFPEFTGKKTELPAPVCLEFK